jgi:hypothetical protein
MWLQLVVFVTGRGIVQKTLIAHVDHHEPSAQLFVTKEEDIIISAHFYGTYGVTMIPAMIIYTRIGDLPFKGYNNK